MIKLPSPISLSFFWMTNDLTVTKKQHSLDENHQPQQQTQTSRI